MMREARPIAGAFCVPKLSGADFELGNFVSGGAESNGSTSSGREASRMLLAQIDGCRPASGYTSYASYGTAYSGGNGVQAGFDPQDWGRCYLPSNGGCAYIDLDHLEMCLPETLSAYDHVASFRAMLCIAEAAREAANMLLPEDREIQVLVNNSDGLGHSYGSHLNFLISRRAWDDIFNRRLHYMLFLASYQISSIVFAGQGKVGSEDHRPEVGYQIAQRSEFCRQVAGAQTPWNRPSVNSRDEALCGDGSSKEPPELARLHVIFYDNTLTETASLLKVGVMQLILTLVENEFVNPDLVLDDPIGAVLGWSHDPTLRTRARMVSGKQFTATELQWRFLEQARRFEEHVGFDGWVPRAPEILDLWEKTLSELERRDWPALSRKLDWVLKKQFLDRAVELCPDLDWRSDELKHLDHMYASLNPAEGLYWDAERRGEVDRIIDEDRVRFFLENPPEDTRAWTRAMLLRQGSEAVTRMDWDSIEFRIQGEDNWPHYKKVMLANPLESGLAGPEAGLLRNPRSLEETLDAMSVETPGSVTYRAYPLYGSGTYSN